MNRDFEKIILRLDEPTAALFLAIDALVHESVDEPVNMKIWQNAPVYYAGGDETFKPITGCKHNRSVHVLLFGASKYTTARATLRQTEKAT